MTTSYRLTPGRVEVRSGLLNKRVVSTPLDRVRTVDLTASPIHRALGLVTLRVGTGQSGDKGDAKLVLDGLSVAAADQLRSRLLRVSAGRRPAGAGRPDGGSCSPSTRGWVRFAPLTSAGVVIAGAALGLVAQGLRTFEWAPTVDEDELQRLGVTVLVLGGLATVVVVLCVLAVVGYLVTNFGFVLSHTARGRVLAPPPRACSPPARPVSTTPGSPGSASASRSASGWPAVPACRRS